MGEFESSFSASGVCLFWVIIDPSDHEDFRHKSYIFYLNDEAVGNEYVVKIKERKKEWVFGVETVWYKWERASRTCPTRQAGLKFWKL